MKIGVKAYHDEKFIKHFESKADFLEVMAIESKDYSFLEGYKIPIVIHAMHTAFGVDISDQKKGEINMKAINFAIDLANKTNAKKIIVHPGSSDTFDCNPETAEIFLRKFNDKRIIMENLPKRKKLQKSVFAMPRDIESFLRKTKGGFCLDINHAIQSALAEGIDYFDFLKEFLKLNPSHFHLSGQKFSPPQDHLNFSDSKLDLKKIISILPKDAEITLEVSTDIEKTEKDLRLIRSLIKS